MLVYGHVRDVNWTKWIVCEGLLIFNFAHRRYPSVEQFLRIDFNGLP